MLDNRFFWYGNMAGALAGWVFIIYGATHCFDSGGVRFLWYLILALWGVGHPLELTRSLPIAEKAGVALKPAIVKTLIFGITWWIPLKRGVFQK